MLVLVLDDCFFDYGDIFMDSKRNKKKKFSKAIIIIIILLIAFEGRNLYYEYQYYQEYGNEDSIFYIFDKNKKSVGKSIDLETEAKKNNKIKTILDNKENIPEVLLEMLSRNSDMTDYVLGYTENKGKVFSDNIGNVTKGEYPLLLQYDKRWGYGMYGDSVIAISGCGPTSMAMVIAGLTGKNNITPYDIAEYAYNNGYCESVGTSWSFFTEGVKYYNIIGTEVPLSKSRMIEELKSGHPIICSMKKGDFTTTGHLIAIVGVKDGKFIVNDPNSPERSKKLWSYERLESQISNIWAFKTK